MFVQNLRSWFDLKRKVIMRKQFAALPTKS
jgi:hypothetical protein